MREVKIEGQKPDVKFYQTRYVGTEQCANRFMAEINTEGQKKCSKKFYKNVKSEKCAIGFMGETKTKG